MILPGSASSSFEHPSDNDAVAPSTPVHRTTAPSASPPKSYTHDSVLDDADGIGGIRHLSEDRTALSAAVNAVLSDLRNKFGVTGEDKTNEQDREYTWDLTTSEAEEFFKVFPQHSLPGLPPHKTRFEYDSETGTLRLRMSVSILHEQFTAGLANDLLAALRSTIDQLPATLSQELPGDGIIVDSRTASVKSFGASSRSPDASFAWSGAQKPFLVIETEWANPISPEKPWQYLEDGIDVVICAHITPYTRPEQRVEQSNPPEYNLAISIYNLEPNADLNDFSYDPCSRFEKKHVAKSGSSSDIVLQLPFSILSQGTTATISVGDARLLEILAGASQRQHKDDRVQHRKQETSPQAKKVNKKRRRLGTPDASEESSKRARNDAA